MKDTDGNQQREEVRGAGAESREARRELLGVLSQWSCVHRAQLSQNEAQECAQSIASQG